MHVIGNGMDCKARRILFLENPGDVGVKRFAHHVVKQWTAVFGAEDQMDEIFRKRLALGAILPAPLQGARSLF